MENICCLYPTRRTLGCLQQTTDRFAIHGPTIRVGWAFEKGGALFSAKKVTLDCGTVITPANLARGKGRPVRRMQRSRSDARRANIRGGRSQNGSQFRLAGGWHAAGASCRDYAVVITSDGRDLNERLVSAGLARIGLRLFSRRNFALVHRPCPPTVLFWAAERPTWETRLFVFTYEKARESKLSDYENIGLGVNAIEALYQLS